MIVTVTMNPAIDKTITLANLERGGLNRVGNVQLDAGGKGINVSRTVKVLGGETVATGFLGGSTGEKLQKMLTEKGIRCDFVKIKGETRTNIKIMETGLASGETRTNEPGAAMSEVNELGSVVPDADRPGSIVTELNELGPIVTELNEPEPIVTELNESGPIIVTELNESEPIVTELNEPGPIVTAEEIVALVEKLEGYAGPETLVVLSGSVPRGVDKNIYYEITGRMHEKGAAVLLDADGELFANGLKAVPDIVKPNHKELEEYCRMVCGLQKWHEYQTVCERQPESELQPGAEYQVRDELQAGGEPQAGHKQQMEAARQKEREHQTETMMDMAGRLRDMGIRLVAVSMGEKGALFMDRKNCCCYPGLSVKVQSTVGAGDAMVAALAWGWTRGLNLEETAALGMAVSTGAVMTKGTNPPDIEVVEKLLGYFHF